jgi:methylenetetrahydrofolate dehydrogenase (NADP+)/methenyltetrahydrofolate cyclohydrolase
MIIDGKAIAEDIYAAISVSRPLTLGIIVGATNQVTDSFVRIKEKAAGRLGVSLIRSQIGEGASTEDAIGAVAILAGKTDGIIVQLPLAESIDTDAVLAAIPPEKDVDGISRAPIVRPPVAEAVGEILARTGVDPHGKRAAVVGSGRLVGMPVAALLTNLGADVQVITLGDALAPLLDADIIVSGAGQPGLIRADSIKDGVVLIDAGTSESGGKVAGDADPACVEKAAVFTPVPGGVGPIAVAMIFKNLFRLVDEVASR